MAKKETLKKSNNFKLEDVCTLLDEVIQIQLNDPSVISYKMELIKRNLYPQLLYNNWIKHEEVAQRLAIMDEIRMARYEETVLDGDSNINSTKLIWYGKFALRLVEEQHRQFNELAENTTEIEIGFVDEDKD